jgi:hypothetical protein
MIWCIADNPAGSETARDLSVPFRSLFVGRPGESVGRVDERTGST